MAIYAIKAYENMYGGLHGVYDIFVDEYDSLESAQSDAITMSYQVMESYGDIEEALAAEVDEYPEDERDDVYSELMGDNVAYEIWRLVSYCPFTIERIDEMLNKDWDGTIEDYFIFVE